MWSGHLTLKQIINSRILLFFSCFPRPYSRLIEFTTEYGMKESVFIKATVTNTSFMVDGVIVSAVVWRVDFNATSDRT